MEREKVLEREQKLKRERKLERERKMKRERDEERAGNESITVLLLIKSTQYFEVKWYIICSIK